jgi:hypothetical protein
VALVPLPVFFSVIQLLRNTGISLLFALPHGIRLEAVEVANFMGLERDGLTRGTEGRKYIYTEF